MTDVLKQIKHLRAYPLYSLGAIASCKEAADTIESQQTRIELLEKVLDAANPFVQIPEIRKRHINTLALAIADCDG